MDRPTRKGPDYLARLGAAKHRVFADYQLSPEAVDALAVLMAMCAIDIDVHGTLTLNDRLHLSAKLASVAVAVENNTATKDEEAGLREAVRVLAGAF